MPKLSSSMAEESTDDFTKGSILRIYLKDFMTYTKVECFPGRALNLIIGPNGTGKSTIVSAICLGMCGKPSTLARASSIGGYVRNGAEKALIEIELYNPNGQNYIVAREITKDNRSSWKLQGRSVTQAEVEKVIQSLHIQVDNLCQFLPQEQVQNFSRMKDKELLVGTMKAVGNPELEQHFNDLIKMQSELGNVATNQEKEEAELNHLKAENERWEAEVRNFKERESLKVKVRLLEKKKAWLAYKTELDAYKAAAGEANQLKAQYESIAQNFKPLEENMQSKERLLAKSSTVLKSKRERFCNEFSRINSQLMNADAKKAEMDSLVGELNRKRTAEKKRLDEISTLQNQIRGLENDLEDLTAREREAGVQLQEVNRKLNELSTKDSSIHRKRDNAQEEARQLKMEREACASQLEGLRNVDRNRLEMLRRECRDVAESVVWLRSHKDQFQRPVYEPPIISLHMKDPRMAKYLENRVPFQDMTAFFCEDKDDMNLLMRILRDEKKLRGINVVHAPPSEDPTTVEFQPRMAISELRAYGFHSYLRELFTGPEPVIRYLCRNFDVHNIPVGDERAYQQLAVIRERFGSIFRFFYSGNKIISFKTSRYRRDVITQMDEAKPAKWLSESVDVQSLERLQAHLQDLNQRYETAHKAYQNADQEAKAVGQEKEVLIQQKSQIQKLAGDRRLAQTRLEQKRASLRGLEGDAIDLEAEELKVKQECANCIRAYTNQLKKHSSLLEQLFGVDKERLILQVHVDAVRLSVAKLRQRLDEEKEQSKHLKAAVDEAERAAREAKESCAAALREARRISGVQNFDQLDAAVRQELAALPDAVNEIDELIHQLNARVQLMGRADAKVVEEYAARQRRIDELNHKIGNIQDATANLKQRIQNVRDQFLPPLLDLIGRINTNFGRYYASMQCAGEVCLHTGEDQNDFKNFGIKIRVKYRSSEPLQDLSANHHSGGERAVATALYMLAMQELTQVPFRCVDEINQGMDPINERRVFDLLVQTACQETSAQYFLLTPKLLPGLNYSPYMKIHFVQNGEQVMDYKKWQIRKHIQVLKALNGA